MELRLLNIDKEGKNFLHRGFNPVIENGAEKNRL
jgi:hypothetical protein